ncbi:MAG: hypothetical protein LUF30_04240 [Lachnospiraceae bacterium]|nr:hypothetical protein [Lachnospiraceae bacterium]
MQEFNDPCTRQLIRPGVYMAFTRLILACLAMGIWQSLVNQDGYWSVLMIVPPALSAIFFMLAWFIFLRFDGLHVPRFFRRKRKARSQKKRFRGDLLDDVDEDTYTFEELTQEEDDCCAFVANLACAVIFLVVSLIACL